MLIGSPFHGECSGRRQGCRGQACRFEFFFRALEIVARALDAISYEVEGKKQKFSVLALRLLDASGHMSFMTENLFGTEAERRGLVKRRLDYWLPGGKPAVWRLKNFRKVVRQNCAFLSSDVPNQIVLEGFATPKCTVKSAPLLQASPEDQILPKYYLPRTSFQELMVIGEPQFVTVAGLLLGITSPEQTSKGPVRQITLSDGKIRLSGVKVWHEVEGTNLDELCNAEPCMIVLVNFWCGLNDDGSPSKVVNVPKRSRINILAAKDLDHDDQKHLESLKSQTPGETYELEENDKDKGSYTRKSMAEWAMKPALQGSALMLGSLNKVVTDEDKAVSQTLYRMDGVFVQLDCGQEFLTKNGDIFARISATDASGTVHVRAGEDVLKALCGLPETEEGTEEMKRPMHCCVVGVCTLRGRSPLTKMTLQQAGYCSLPEQLGHNGSASISLRS